MKESYKKAPIKIGSYTLAMRACSILKSNGFSCEMHKASDNNGQYGCIYAIYTDDDNLWQAEKMIRSSGIMILP